MLTLTFTNRAKANLRLSLSGARRCTIALLGHRPALKNMRLR